MTALLEQPKVDPTDTDNGVLTHIVNCPEDKPSTEAWLTEARVLGLTVTAVCGYRWVPQRDPEKFPICMACVEAANILIFEEGTHNA